MTLLGVLAVLCKRGQQAVRLSAFGKYEINIIAVSVLQAFLRRYAVMGVETCTSAAVDQCFFRQPKQPDFLSPNLLLPQWQNPVFVLEECDTLTSDISNELAVRRVDDRLFRRDFRGFESTNLLIFSHIIKSSIIINQ